MRKREDTRVTGALLGVAVILGFLMTGCASAPKVINMIPPDEGHVFRNTNKTIKVEAAFGGKETDPLWEGSKIDNITFMGALLTSLAQSHMFTEVNPSENPDYTLTPFIMTQSQPAFGIDMTVTLLVKYTLSNAEDETQLWEKDILSSYTATLGDAFVGVTRIRKANEGAVRENLKSLLQELDAIDFE